MQSKGKGTAAASWAAAPWTGWAAAVVSAGLLELPFPLAGPLPPWRSIFAWFGLVPLLWALLSHPSDKGKDVARVGHPEFSLRRGFLLAYVCGVLWYMGNCYWIYDTMHIHGELTPVVSALILLLFSLVLGLYFGLFGLGLVLVRRATGSVGWALAFAPFLWVALELAAARITSVPWDQLGYSQVDNGLASSLAPWTGVYGVSFVLVAANAILLSGCLEYQSPPLFSSRSKWRLIAIPQFFAVLIAIWLTHIGGSGIGYSQYSPSMPTAVLVQPNLDVSGENSWLRPGEWDSHLAQFVELGKKSCKSYIPGIPDQELTLMIGQVGKDYSNWPFCPAALPPPDLIVWPESPAPFFEQDPRFKSAMASVAQADQAPVLAVAVGSDFSPVENEWLDHVSAVAYSAAGSEVGRYDKIHLVPWGEYVPYPQVFFFAKKLTGKVASYTPGTARNVLRLQSANGETHRYGVFICYEAVFADEVRQFARSGAEAFVNVSDDGWYGDTSAPWQHLNMARMRAIENRRWILRATNDGVTASIDPYGRVRQSIARHQVDALPAQFAFRSDITFYTAHGDVFAWLCVVVSLGIAIWAGGKLMRNGY